MTLTSELINKIIQNNYIHDYYDTWIKSNHFEHVTILLKFMKPYLNWWDNFCWSQFYAPIACWRRFRLLCFGGIYYFGWLNYSTHRFIWNKWAIYSVSINLNCMSSPALKYFWQWLTGCCYWHPIYSSMQKWVEMQMFSKHTFISLTWFCVPCEVSIRTLTAFEPGCKEIDLLRIS